MSENIEFVKKVKPVYVDALGNEIRAPFISIPFNETVARDTRVNTPIAQDVDIDIDALFTATEDLYITGIAMMGNDGVEFCRERNRGFQTQILYTVAAVNYLPHEKFWDGVRYPPIFWGGATYYWYQSVRFNPLIKIPYTRTAAELSFYNHTELIVNNMDVYLFYFILPYAR